MSEQLSDGRSQKQVAKQLVDSGWDQDNADEFVAAVNTQMSEAGAKSGGGGGKSWLIWIGALLLINLLSYLFDWPFWIY